MKTDFTCGFIGLGLIGGSIARALRQAHPSCRILAYDPDEASLSMAKRDSVVDFSLSDLDDIVDQQGHKQCQDACNPNPPGFFWNKHHNGYQYPQNSSVPQYSNPFDQRSQRGISHGILKNK